MRKILSVAVIRKFGSFGTSLLLSNTPMSPKVVNGSFAAIFEKDESVLSPWTHWLSQLRNETKMSPSKFRCEGNLNSRIDRNLFYFFVIFLQFFKDAHKANCFEVANNSRWIHVSTWFIKCFRKLTPVRRRNFRNMFPQKTILRRKIRRHRAKSSVLVTARPC